MIQITVSAETVGGVVDKLHEMLNSLEQPEPVVIPRGNLENSHDTMEKTPVENPEPVEKPNVSEPEKTPSENVKNPSLADVRAALISLREKKGHAATKALLETFGCEKAPDLPENVYADVIRKAEEEMKNV